jgi:hypothetical protein
LTGWTSKVYSMLLRISPAVQAAQALHWLVSTRCSAAALAATTLGKQQEQQQQQQSIEDAAFLRTIESAFGSCNHAHLSSLAGSLLMPCLDALLRHTQGGIIDVGLEGKCCAFPAKPCLTSGVGPAGNGVVSIQAGVTKSAAMHHIHTIKSALDAHTGMAARGRVWALLGLLRLHLAAPPPGADPAAKYAQLRQHMLGLLSLRVEPELALRRQYQRLPGG